MNRKTKQKRVFVAMSGGVDSSVAALLLQRQGYDVVGIFMRPYNIDGCAERDAEDARRAAAAIGIPFYVWDFEEEYKKKVVNYMVDGYRKGLTPNPDVMCNKEIKFGLFLEKALRLGADYIATGHYVRRVNGNSQLVISKKKSRLPVTNYQLQIARDQNKDQSYFLWTLTQKQLQYCLFPIGEYLKPEVREIARKAGLPTAEKKDSQGICFLGKVTLEDFLGQYIPPRPGTIVTTDGKKIGQHRGAAFYTIGQRHLRLTTNNLQQKGSRETKPVYVAEKNIKTNRLVVAYGDNHPALHRKEITIDQVNFSNPKSHRLIRANRRIVEDGIKVLARVRYRQPLTEATLILADQKADSRRYRRQSALKSASIGGRIVFNEPIKFVAPGQSAVFYDRSGEMLGGGIII